MKKLILLFSSFFCFACRAQINKTIVKAHAYYVIPAPGNIPVESDGKTVKLSRDTIYTIFMEVHGCIPKWKKAWIGSNEFSLIILPVKFIYNYWKNFF